MARVLFTLSLLLLVFTTVRVYGAPSQTSESSKLNRQERTFGFSLLGSRDWDEFRRWPFVTMTPFRSMMNLFEEENSKERLIKRLEALEQGHKRIIGFLMKKQDSKSANQCRPSSTDKSTEKHPESVTADFTPDSTTVPNLNVRVQTNAAVEPTTQSPMPTRITAEVKDIREPSTTTKITTTEIEGKMIPATPIKTTSTGVKVKMIPATPIKTTSTGVKVKVTPPTPIKTTLAKDEDKMEPSSTKIISKEVEQRFEPSTKITPLEVMDKVKPSSTNITSTEFEQRLEPSTKITPLEVEHKVGPSLTKITPPEVEDKEEPSTTSITSTAVEDKVEPSSSSRPEEVSKEKESTEKTESPQEEFDAPPATTTAKTLTETEADSNPEATTRIEENNDVNNVFI